MIDGMMQVASQVIETARQMNSLGINVNKSGNVSARVRIDDIEGFFITPTGIAYEELSPEDIVFIPFNIFVIKKNMLLPKLSNVLIYLYCLIIFFLIFNQIKSILFFVPIFIYLFIEIFFYTYFAFKDKSIDGFYMYFADFNLSICDFYNKLKDKEKSEYIFIISKLFGFFVFLLLFISVIIRSEFVVYLSIFTLILSATVVYGFKSGRVKFVYENQKQQKLNKKLKRKK